MGKLELGNRKLQKGTYEIDKMNLDKLKMDILSFSNEGIPNISQHAFSRWDNICIRERERERERASCRAEPRYLFRLI